jgi:hypothetical protein
MALSSCDLIAIDIYQLAEHFADARNPPGHLQMASVLVIVEIGTY